MKKVLFITLILMLGAGLYYTAPAGIKIVKPADRDVYTQDQLMPIQWRKLGQLPPQVKIQLVDQGNHFVKTIAGGTQNDGRHQWRVPTNVNPGSYRVKIICIGSNVKALSGLFKIKAKAVQSGPTWDAPQLAMISSLKVNQQSPANSCTNTQQRVSINLPGGIHILTTATSVFQPIQYKFLVEVTNPETGYDYPLYNGNWTQQSYLNLNPTYNQITDIAFPNGVSSSSIPASIQGRVTVKVKNSAQSEPPQMKEICFRIWL